MTSGRTSAGRRGDVLCLVAYAWLVVETWGWPDGAVTAYVPGCATGASGEAACVMR